MFLYSLLSCFLIGILFFYLRRGNTIQRKKILIIGGTSGLGLELAKKLYRNGNQITITSRSKDKLDKTLKIFTYSNQSIINGFVFDSKTDPVQSDDNYDIVFYCAGLSIPGYFSDQKIDQFQYQMNVNYIGMLRSLYFYQKYNNRPFYFVMFSSTLAFLSVPGFASYSPSKACLKSFFETEKAKLECEGVKLKIFYCCSMATPGFEEEEMVKPTLTRTIEHSNVIVNPEEIADYLVKNLENRNTLSYDWFTYFLMIRNECETLTDYLFFPFSILVAFFAKAMVCQKAKIYLKNTNSVRNGE